MMIGKIAHLVFVYNMSVSGRLKVKAFNGLDLSKKLQSLEFLINALYQNETNRLERFTEC